MAAAAGIHNARWLSDARQRRLPLQAGLALLCPNLDERDRQARMGVSHELAMPSGGVIARLDLPTTERVWK